MKDGHRSNVKLCLWYLSLKLGKTQNLLCRINTWYTKFSATGKWLFGLLCGSLPAVKSVVFFTMREYLPIIIKREGIGSNSPPKERKIVISNYYLTHWLLAPNLVMLSGYTCLWTGGQADPWGFSATAQCWSVAVVPPLHRVCSQTGEGAEIVLNITGHYGCIYIKHFESPQWYCSNSFLLWWFRH